MEYLGLLKDIATSLLFLPTNTFLKKYKIRMQLA